jgi:hypothetical protein
MITFQETGLKQQGYVAICERHPCENNEEGPIGVVPPRNVMMSPLKVSYSSIKWQKGVLSDLHFKHLSQVIDSH